MNSEPSSSRHVEATSPTPDILDAQQTACCVVGGGPAGAVLSYILASKGIEVLLLESLLDFDRDFRGNTLHPAILEVIDELGLADRLLQVPHTKVSTMTVLIPNGLVEIADLSHLHIKFPSITLMPQSRFLDFLTSEAQRYPSFHLVMGARVEALITISAPITWTTRCVAAFFPLQRDTMIREVLIRKAHIIYYSRREDGFSSPTHLRHCECLARGKP